MTGVQGRKINVRILEGQSLHDSTPALRDPAPPRSNPKFVPGQSLQPQAPKVNLSLLSLQASLSPQNDKILNSTALFPITQQMITWQLEVDCFPKTQTSKS